MPRLRPSVGTCRCLFLRQEPDEEDDEDDDEGDGKKDHDDDHDDNGYSE